MIIIGRHKPRLKISNVQNNSIFSFTVADLTKPIIHKYAEKG